MRLSQAYQLLDLQPGTATIQSLKSAFRRRALATHPDRREGTVGAEFIAVKEAFDLLSSRVTADMQRRRGTARCARRPSIDLSPIRAAYRAGKRHRRVAVNQAEVEALKAAEEWKVLGFCALCAERDEVSRACVEGLAEAGRFFELLDLHRGARLRPQLRDLVLAALEARVEHVAARRCSCSAVQDPRQVAMFLLERTAKVAVARRLLASLREHVLTLDLARFSSSVAAKVVLDELSARGRFLELASAARRLRAFGRRRAFEHAIELLGRHLAALIDNADDELLRYLARHTTSRQVKDQIVAALLARRDYSAARRLMRELLESLRSPQAACA